MKWLVRLYPREWRERYGAELEYTLEQLPPSLGHVLDVAKGAILMHFSVSKKPKLILMCGLFFAVLMYLASFAMMPTHYGSTARARLVGDLQTIPIWLNDEMLGKLRDRHGLYPNLSRPEALYEMKKRVVVRPADGKKAQAFSNLRVSFFDRDPGRARAITGDLLSFGEAAKVIEVLEPAGLPSKGSKPERAILAGAGLFGGMLFAIAGSWFVRRVKPA